MSIMLEQLTKRYEGYPVVNNVSLEVADGEWRSMIMFGLYTGQRLADIASLTWSQVDLVNHEIRFFTRKTHRRLVVPIAPPPREHLLKLAGSDHPSAPIHPKAAAVVAAASPSAR